VTGHTGESGRVQSVGREVWRVQNRQFPSNTYIVGLGDGRGCVVIDPGLDIDVICESLVSIDLAPQAILCTHGHFDHIGGAAEIRAQYGAPVYLHNADLRVAKSANFTMLICKVPGKTIVPIVDGPVDDLFCLDIGPHPFRFRHLPGHTPGSCLIEYDNYLFSGDSIYRDSVGLNSLPGEDVQQLAESLRAVWDSIPDDVVVYPGHGNYSSFGEIKIGNSDLRALVGLRESRNDRE
jgi:hydroxyacylglutathione hydrolase